MEKKYKILLFCAHPDDAELCAGGTIKKLINNNCEVKVIVMTNGNVGNGDINKKKTESIRNKEMIDAAALGGFNVSCEDINDGEVLPSLDNRMKVIRAIREFKPDIIITHRSNDYHPDHRYTSMLVQDSLVLICCQNYCPEVESLNYTPITLFFWDRFTKPNSFCCDIITAIDDVFDFKVTLLAKHSSQFNNKESARKELSLINSRIANDYKAILNSKYQREVQFAEAFEICEYAKETELNKFERIKDLIFHF